MPQEQGPLLHVFSARSDEGWVRGALLPRLGLADHQVLTRLDYELGMPLMQEIERAVKQCRITVVVVSDEARCDWLLKSAANLALFVGAEVGQPRLVVLTRNVSPKSLDLTQRALVGLDCSSAERTSESLAVLRARLSLSEPVVERPRCPFPGLSPFKASNRGLMFGRDQERDELLRRIRACHSRILLLGHSGSGKSSLIHASVLPTLPEKGYLVEVITETGDLPRALRDAMVGFQIDRLLEIMDNYVAAIGNAAWPAVEQARTRLQSIVVADPRRRILVVDSLESIFIDRDDAKRKTFFHVLGALWSRPWCTVILCLRSDFEGPLKDEPCWRELEDSAYSLPQLSEAGLRAAIIEPARLVEVYFEQALVERLIREVDPDRASAALPMLQVALEELWERLTDRYLSLESYESIVATNAAVDSWHSTPNCNSNRTRQRPRGLAVVLSVHADKILQRLSVKDGDLAKRVLLDLVQFGEGRPHTRRQRTFRQLCRHGVDSDVARVVNALVDGRLITTDTGGHANAPTAHFHLVHDALIEGWSTLATLVARNQGKLAKDRRLAIYEQGRDKYPGRHVRRWTFAAAMSVLALAGLGAAWTYTASRDTSACERAISAGEWRHGLDLCLEHNRRTRDPDDLVRASEAYLRLGEFDKARQLGQTLAGGTRDAAGHLLLSKVLLQIESPDYAGARSEAAVAFTAYLRAGDLQGLAQAAITRSQASAQQGDVAASLDAAEQAVAITDYLGDTHRQVDAHLVHAAALQASGDRLGAEDALRRAQELATTACERTRAYLMRGMYEVAIGHDVLATATIRLAETASQGCEEPQTAKSIDLMTAWLAPMSGSRDALRRLDRVESRGTTQISLFVRAKVAAARDLDDSENDLRQVEARPMDPEWTWKVSYMRAELAELRGGSDNDARAETYYQLAIAGMAGPSTCDITRAACIVVMRRAPFVALMALYARTGRWSDLLAVLLELEARERGRLSVTAAFTSRRGAPEASGQALAAVANSTVDDVLAAWRSRDLVIVFASPQRLGEHGGGRVYRLRIDHGQVGGEDTGDAAQASAWTDALVNAPDDLNAARGLGRIIVPLGSNDEVLDVLALGALARIPLAALRDDDGSWMTRRRPLARVLELRPGVTRADGRDPPVILTNPRGDLSGAAQEGDEVRRKVGSDARIYSVADATLARLREARHASLLHIAVHGPRRGRWPALELADGWITPPEIVDGGLAPRLAMLVVSASAIGDDPEHHGSLAAGFLAAGTTTVIAAERSIEDQDSQRFIDQFYKQPDWPTDPARALARAQATLSAIPGRTAVWASFGAYRRPPDESKEDLE